MSKDKEQLETTFYRFYSEIRAFLSKLISDPIKATPSKYLKERDFGKTKIINVLLDKGVLERKESIKDQTDSDLKKPTYIVKYKVRKKNFETKIHRIYSKYFEKNLPEKEKTEEIDECASCGSVGGANGMEYDVPFNANSPVRQHALYEGEKKKKPKKNIYVTQRQFDYIQDTINSINGGDMEIGLDEATATTNVGAMGDYTANGLVLKTSDGKKDPCYDR